MRDFPASIAATPKVFDGAMGTMIYAKGVFLNACYDELCLSRPELILGIHRDYVEAGAEVIETNSFAANRIKLQSHGLADKAAAINRQAAVLARRAAGEDLFVAGSVGPCLASTQLWQPEAAATLREAFDEQIRALAEGGADLICLETFARLDELLLAAGVAAETGLPVFASFTLGERGETAVGTPLETMVAALADAAQVHGIGINCGVGPAHAYEFAERALALTSKPLLVMPNAGMPRSVEGRMIYLTNPEYFTEYAKKLIELGVRAVGGCCGTTPEHIRQTARAVKTLSRVKRHVAIRAFKPEEATVAVVPPKTKSRFACRMLAGHKVASVELLPPKTFDLSGLLAKARQCHLHGVDAINIPDGPRASARVSPMIAALAIQREVGIETILHYCCRDRNLIGMQSDLLGGYAAGLRNFLIITGDPPKLGDYPDATGVFDVDAIGLTRVVHNLNHGRDVGGSPMDPPTGIFTGVGANPCAVAPGYELDRFRQKIEAGAEFAITQPVFDADALFRFLDRVEQAGPGIPTLAGVWPLTSFKNAEFMRNEVPGVEVPDSVMARMAACRTREDGMAEGVRIAREMCERVRDRVAGFQVSAPFGRVDVALQVLGITE
jgi:methionine synthase I (cobalamin-dependent)/5,10-methylenetetrahydrofolate reductase